MVDKIIDYVKLKQLQSPSTCIPRIFRIAFPFRWQSCAQVSAHIYDTRIHRIICAINPTELCSAAHCRTVRASYLSFICAIHSNFHSCNYLRCFDECPKQIVLLFYYYDDDCYYDTVQQQLVFATNMQYICVDIETLEFKFHLWYWWLNSS